MIKETKKYSLHEINSIIGGILNQIDKDIIIEKIAPPLLADEKSLALAIQDDEIENLKNSKAIAAVVPLGSDIQNISTIEVERPRVAMMKLLHMFYIPPDTPKEIHPTAVIHPEAKLGENVSIGPNVYVGRGVVIGNNSKIMANVTIGKFSKIGENCLFHPGVHIGDFSQIGNNVIINHGASIGGDGFSFVTDKTSNAEAAKGQGQAAENQENQVIYKIPSLGAVEIHDNVEIGANATIDKGTLENTVIGESTKIDNLVMIGHNCKIGKNCFIISQVGISGSCVIGDRVVIAGQAGLADHLTIGDDTIIMARAGLSKSFPAKSIVMGYPATQRKEFIKQLKTIKDAGPLLKDIKAFLKTINQEN